ncbi:MAG: hypothetical protein C5B60_07390 [Chloroflexi bacterium]|nr:MAG: hypothetical protein C5B60_07390 [Chloroflexota bacterium]
MLTFPVAPVVNQRFPDPPIVGVPGWRWSGVSWDPITAPIEVAPTAPTMPVNSLWFNSTDGSLQLFFDDGDSKQWVEIGGPQGPIGLQGQSGPPGPLGPTGATGPPSFPDSPVDGAYLRKNGVWIPLTHASAVLTANVALNVANQLFDGPMINVGTEGTWLVMGTACITATAILGVTARIWDGITIIADAMDTVSQANVAASLSMSGIITDPAGPVRLSAASVGGATGTLTFNMWPTFTPSSIRGTHITVMRIG